MPEAAVDDTISTVPILLPVATANNPPKPTAGARHAKKRNITAARHYEIETKQIELSDENLFCNQSEKEHSLSRCCIQTK